MAHYTGGNAKPLTQLRWILVSYAFREQRQKDQEVKVLCAGTLTGVIKESGICCTFTMYNGRHICIFTIYILPKKSRRKEGASGLVKVIQHYLNPKCHASLWHLSSLGFSPLFPFLCLLTPLFCPIFLYWLFDLSQNIHQFQLFSTLCYF
jgi:hypothetical protein